MLCGFDQFFLLDNHHKEALHLSEHCICMHIYRIYNYLPIQSVLFDSPILNAKIFPSGSTVTVPNFTLVSVASTYIYGSESLIHKAMAYT